MGNTQHKEDQSNETGRPFMTQEECEEHYIQTLIGPELYAKNCLRKKHDAFVNQQIRRMMEDVDEQQFQLERAYDTAVSLGDPRGRIPELSEKIRCTVIEMRIITRKARSKTHLTNPEIEALVDWVADNLTVEMVFANELDKVVTKHLAELAALAC